MNRSARRTKGDLITLDFVPDVGTRIGVNGEGGRGSRSRGPTSTGRSSRSGWATSRCRTTSRRRCSALAPGLRIEDLGLSSRVSLPNPHSSILNPQSSACTPSISPFPSPASPRRARSTARLLAAPKGAPRRLGGFRLLAAIRSFAHLAPEKRGTTRPAPSTR